MQAPHEQRIQPVQPLASSAFSSLGLRIDFTGIAMMGSQGLQLGKRYYVSVSDAIERIVTTRLGARVMRPDFGSNLYLLRDREFDALWKVLATRYIFDAIRQFEPRVSFGGLVFHSDPITGKTSFSIAVEPARAVV